MRSVVLEGLVIGLLASVIGLLFGLGIAKGMVALFSALGVDLPKASTVIAPHTIIVSLVLGTVITLIASVLPAKRATRVPPIAAVREGATLPATRLAAHSLKAGLAVTLGSMPRSRLASSPAEPAGSRSPRSSAAAFSGCSPASRCSLPGSSSRWPAWSAGRRAARAASPASWPERMPSAIPAGPRRPPPRS